MSVSRLPRWALVDYCRALAKSKESFDSMDALIICTVRHAMDGEETGLWPERRR